MAVLGAAADAPVQAFIDAAVSLVRAVAAVVPPITEAHSGDAAAVGAHEERAIAEALWGHMEPGLGGLLYSDVKDKGQQHGHADIRK